MQNSSVQIADAGAIDVRSQAPGFCFTVLLSALTALTALSIDMSLPALPQLQRSFGVDVSHAQLVLGLFLVGFGISQFICGPLSDHYGRKPVLLVGIALFAVSSFACATAQSFPLLLLFRFLEGAGASVGPILARAIVRDLFDQRMSSGILSSMTQVLVLAPILAPTIGGLLLVHYGWHSIFLVLGICGTALGLICWMQLRETLQHEHRGSGRFMRVIRGFGVVLAHPPSRRYILATCFSYGGLFAYISGSPFVYMDVYHVPREHFGYYFALPALALLIGAAANRRMLRNRELPQLLQIGVYTVLVAGALELLCVWLKLGGIAGVVLPIMLYLFGLGLLTPNAVALALAHHGSIAGVASSLIGGLQTLAGALAG